MDLDACTRCGRCQDNCPAYLSGKPLSPKKVIQDLKSALLERRAKGSNDDIKSLLGEVITEDEIWACTTCRSCQEHCPVFVEHIDKIIELRRNLVMEQAQMPETVMGTLRNIETRGHPWRGTMHTRTDWIEDLKVKVLSESDDVEVVYWVGCTEALDDRAMKIAIAMAKIMNAAGVNFGILGDEESCCGEPARRMGNEYLFQLQAEQNIETLKNYNVKKIVTACPHCFNTLKNEYPQFGGDFEVIHHTQFIADLLKQGKLKPIYWLKKKVTYQDPCYLGRYNEIYQPPRKILTSIPLLKFTEMDRKKQAGFRYAGSDWYMRETSWQRMVAKTKERTKGMIASIPPIKLLEGSRQKERAFCCGGGGGRSWMEETGTRISYMRTDDAIRTNCEIIATACPFCMLMFEDGVKAKEVEETIKVMDVAELIAEAI
jgi:Fe-S oxidoreductase